MNYYEYQERKQHDSSPAMEPVELPDILVGQLSEESETGRHLVEQIRKLFSDM